MSELDNLIKEAGLVKVDPNQPPVDTPPPPDDTPPPPPPDDTPPPPHADTPPPVDHFKIVSEKLGREFKSDDDITAFTGELTAKEQRIKDLEEREAAWATERAELEAGVDPMSYFASPELFTLNGLLKKFPEKNPATLAEISTTDFSKSHIETPIDVLALDLLLEHPGIYANKEDAKEDILAKYGIDEKDENDQWVISAQAKRRMQVDAKTATDKFADLQKQIEKPNHVDLVAQKADKLQKETERKNKLTEATAPLFTKVIPASLNAIEIPVTIKGEDGKEVTETAFKYEIPESYAKSKDVQTVLQQIRNSTIQNEADWNPEKEAKLKEDVTQLLLANYYWKHRAEIDAARVADLMVKVKDEAWMKRHNVRPLRQDGQAPRVDPNAAKLEKQQNDFLKKQGIKV